MMTEPPETRRAKTIDGASIAYKDFGEGPLTLVVIPGWVSHVEIYWEWPGFARLLRRLAQHARAPLRGPRRARAQRRTGRAPAGGLGVALARSVDSYSTST